VLVASVCAVPLALDATSTTAAAAPGNVDFGDLDPTGLIDLGPLAPVDPGALTFLLGLHRDQAGLERHIQDTSEPASPRYGERRSIAELAGRFGASTTARNTVVDYFATTFGVEADIDPTGSYAVVDLSLAQAQTVFSTTWNVYGYPVSSYFSGVTLLYPNAAPTLPIALQEHVEVVDGAVVLYQAPDPADSDALPPAVTPVAGGFPLRTGTAEGCADIDPGAFDRTQPKFGLAPNQLKSAYQLDQLHGRGIQGQGMRVAVIDDALYDPAWLATYRSCFGIDATTVTDHVVGSPDTSVDGMSETILDLSVLSFAAPKVDRFDVFMFDTSPNPSTADEAGGMVQMFTAPLDASSTGGIAPDVISASFGLCEQVGLYWKGHGPAIRILENVLSTAAAAGITYVVASGDSGSSGCFHNLKDEVPEAEALSVSYPSSSKWVTAVGGTNVALNADNSIASSGVWNDTLFGVTPAQHAGAGGGGTSTLIGRPWYQMASVVGSNDHRVVPDISLFADELPGYLLYAPTDPSGTGSPAGPPAWTYIGGTSAATPLFSGMALLLGQQAKANAQPTLGFANPLLYDLGEGGSAALLDITEGNNNMFPSAVACCDAAPGFDQATGWGSPRAQAMTGALAAPTVSIAAAGSSDGSLTATYTATVDVPAGRILSYEWDTNGDGLTDATTTGPTLSTTAAVAGVQTTRLTVRTSMGRLGSGVASATLTVPPPVATPLTPATPRSLAFAG